MNVFVIPSIYPSKDHPLSGIYIEEQIKCLARNHPDINFGICLWGQNEIDNQLWAKQIFKNIGKIFRSFSRKSDTKKVSDNLKIYYEPRFYWSKKFLKGNRRSLLKACFKNLKAFEKDCGRCNLIHAHVTYPAGYFASKISKKRSIPYIITEHMTRLSYENYLTSIHPIQKEALQVFSEAPVFITVSEFLKKELQKIKVRDIEVIHNLTDEKLFTPEPAANKEKGTYRVAVISNVLHTKGYYELLDSIARVKRVIPGAKYKLIGEGDDLEFYKKRAGTLKIENEIEWKGKLNRDQVIKEIQMADAVMMTSQHETFGQVFAEAIACGKPIICTRCGGPEEIVNSKNGVLAEKRDSVDVAKKLIYLLQNLGKYHAEDIRKDFENRFSSKVITPKIIEVYKRIANA